MKKVAYTLLAFLLVLSISCKKDKKEVRSGVISFVLGDVQITEKGIKTQALIGDKVVEGMVLKTSVDSNIEIDFDGNIISITENSTVEITKLIRGVSGDESSEFFVSNGKILSNITKKLAKGDKFNVKTRTITAGVRGTEFLVSEKNGKSVIACTQGKVAVKKIDAAESEIIELKEGQEVNAVNGKIATIKSISQENKNNIENIKKKFLDQKKAIRDKFEKDRDKIRKAVVDQRKIDKKKVKDLKEKNKKMVENIKSKAAQDKENLKADTASQKDEAASALQKQKDEQKKLMKSMKPKLK